MQLLMLQPGSVLIVFFSFFVSEFDVAERHDFQATSSVQPQIKNDQSITNLNPALPI